MRPVGPAAGAALMVLVLACGQETSTTPPATQVPGQTAAAPATAPFAAMDAGAVPGGPGEGKRYAIGRPIAARDVARWNTDVGPDGLELPAGRGDVGTGARLFAEKCASCHGPRGAGIPPAFPALVGRDAKAEGFAFATDVKLVKTIGNYWPNATTVFDYVKRAMPLTQPGSLSDSEVYALTAWLLAANKVIPEDAALDAASLRKVTMPYADRFVPDTRRGGAEVK